MRNYSEDFSAMNMLQLPLLKNETKRARFGGGMGGEGKA